MYRIYYSTIYRNWQVYLGIIFQKRNLEVRQVYDLGALIRSLRKERKITQKKLGEMLDVTEGTISKYEANTMTPPFETLRSIASIFNVSMDTLCGMKHQGTLSTHGLTEAQTETVKALVDAYRIKNAQTSRQLTQEQFAVLGKITAELTK